MESEFSDITKDIANTELEFEKKKKKNKAVSNDCRLSTALGK